VVVKQRRDCGKMRAAFLSLSFSDKSGLKIFIKYKLELLFTLIPEVKNSELY
jgi:hypothetical protein